MKRLCELTTIREQYPSPIGEYFSDIIDSVLLPTPRDFVASLTGLYVAERCAPPTVAREGLILSRLRSAGVDLSNENVRELELELLDFALFDRSHRVLCLVGGIGAGKSTTVHYVFGHLVRIVQGLDHILPLILDCSNVKKTFFHKEIWELAVEAWKSAPWLAERVAKRSIPLFESMRNLFSTEFLGESDCYHALVRLGGLMRSLTEFKLRAVVVLDNTDRLRRATERTMIRRFARAVNLGYDIATVVPLRPDTYRSNDEVGPGQDSFIGYLQPMSRPKLTAVLEKRIAETRNQVVSKIREKEGGVTISREGMEPVTPTEETISTYFMNLSSLLLSDPMNAQLLWDFANGNLRTVFLIVSRISRYDEKMQKAFVEDDPAIGRAPTPPLLEAIIKSHMLAISPMYGAYDIPEFGLPNLLRHKESREVGVATKYWLLSYVAGIGTSIPVREVEIVAKQAGLSHVSVKSLINELLLSRLLEETQYDSGTTSIEYLRVSSLGRLFLDRLVCNPDYLYQVVTDCFVDGGTLSIAYGSDPSFYATRVSGLVDVLKGALESESALTDSYSRSQRYDVIKTVDQQGLLCERMLKGLREVRRWAQSSSREKVREAGVKFLAQIGEMEPRVGNRMRRFSKLLEKHGISELPNVDESANIPNGRITLRIYRSPKTGQRFEAEIELSGELDLTCSALVGLWSLEGQDLKVASPCQSFFEDESALRCSMSLAVTGKSPSVRGLFVRILRSGMRYADIEYDEAIGSDFRIV